MTCMENIGLEPPVAFALDRGADPSEKDNDMPASRDDLMDFFASQEIEVTTYDHPPVFTVEESGELHDKIPGGHTKNLFLKDKKGRLFLIVLLHDATVDLKRIHSIIGAQGRVSFGNADVLMEVLGVIPGSVTPFALINDREAQRVTPVFDAAMMQHDRLNYHPLSNDASTTISRDDLLKFVAACGHSPAVLAVSSEAQDAGL